VVEQDLKLNLGSGVKRIPGFLNVDYSSECSPDIVMNLEETPWSFETDSVSHIIMSHVLEHLGQTPDGFLSIMKELYRVCKNDAVIEVTVPHPAHDDFLSDPTHVRAITPMTLALFDKEENLRWRAIGAGNSPLALQCDVNFKIAKFENRASPRLLPDLNALEQKDPFLAKMFFQFGRNIIGEMYFQLRVIKSMINSPCAPSPETPRHCS
jgi:hypothetical protein